MIVPKHIVWSVKETEIDLSNPVDRAWWIKQVLINGRMEDVLALDFGEIERLLPGLYLPPPVKKLWSDYFARQRGPHEVSAGRPSNPLGD